VSIDGVRQGVNEFLRVVYAKPLIICYVFAAVLSFIFGLPLLTPMILFGRSMVCSHRLYVQTTVVSDTILLQFAMQVLTGSCESPVCGNGWS